MTEKAAVTKGIDMRVWPGFIWKKYLFIHTAIYIIE